MEFYDWGTKESSYGRDIEIQGIATNLNTEFTKEAKPFAAEAEEAAMIGGNGRSEEEELRESAISLTRASLTRACLPPAITVEEIAPAEKKFTTTTAQEDAEERAPPLAPMGQKEMMMAMAHGGDDDNKQQMAEANPTTRRKRGNFFSKFFHSR